MEGNVKGLCEICKTGITVVIRLERKYKTIMKGSRTC